MTRDDIIRMAREAGSIDSEEVIETVFAAFTAAAREMRPQRDELLEALRRFADTDLTNPIVRDTFCFDVLSARAAIAKAEGKP